MILWKSKEVLETRGGNWPCAAFRSMIECTANFDGISLGFYRQYQLRSTSIWETSHVGIYEFRIDKRFLWGSKHVYYDGPHCSYSIGPIHFSWNGRFRTGYCKKCMLQWANLQQSV